MSMGLHSMFMFYQDDEEIENIEEMEQPKPDLPPFPLNEPQEDLEEQADEGSMLTRQTLKERIQERIANEDDPNIKASLQWELHLLELVGQRFPKVDQIYESHR